MSDDNDEMAELTGGGFRSDVIIGVLENTINLHAMPVIRIAGHSGWRPNGSGNTRH